MVCPLLFTLLFTLLFKELAKYGDSIYLNEQNYWGGGPFANGCTALPDLWSQGLSDELFLWLHVQHLNPTPDRQVYSCPPRPYYVLAALRLAKLVESIRRKQANVPITIVCHSQGNMIGMAAAFLGDKLPDVTDAANRTGRCVADTYVLCNPPYSLVESNFTESFTQSSLHDREGRSGRQTLKARTETLKAFFEIVRKQSPNRQNAELVAKFMDNAAHGFTVQEDRQKYGYGIKPSTTGRVTLYCNPHDQVISSTSVQGIGWRGMSDQEIAITGGVGLFSQRVFSQGFEVGQKAAPGKTSYYNYWTDQHFWTDQHGKPSRPAIGAMAFWGPTALFARYSIAKGTEANANIVGRIMTFVTAPLFIVPVKKLNIGINALPPGKEGEEGWKIALQAPPLPEPFKPEAGGSADTFDQDSDAPGAYRDVNRVYAADDPYGGAKPGDKDAPQGTEQSEAALRYEQHGRLRMEARRQGKYKNSDKVTDEDEPDKASPEYKAWRSKNIKTYLAAAIDAHATDHSTIMTNPMHAQKALAYDVAIGVNEIKQEDLYELRKAADWRLLKGLDKSDPHKIFEEYFVDGTFKGDSPYDWANPKNGKSSDGAMPEKIADHRQYAAPRPGEGG